MSMTASEAANAIGLTRQGVIKAIKSGKISASKDQKGAWKIEPVELFRAYSPVNQNTATVAPKVEAGIQASLQAEIEHLQALLERADQRADEWKNRADQEAEERRRLTLMLTDQRAQESRKSIWARLSGRSS